MEYTLAQIRNAVQLPNGMFDCEIDHPTHGWMPFTASADDDTEHGPLIHSLILASGDYTLQSPLINSSSNILAAPQQGFGGPSIKEQFNGNR